MKKLRIVDTYLECGLRFFIFSQEGLQNGRQRHKKIACTFSLAVHACVHVRAHQPFWEGVGDQSRPILKVS